MPDIIKDLEPEFYYTEGEHKAHLGWSNSIELVFDDRTPLITLTNMLSELRFWLETHPNAKDYPRN